MRCPSRPTLHLMSALRQRRRRGERPGDRLAGVLDTHGDDRPEKLEDVLLVDGLALRPALALHDLDGVGSLRDEVAAEILQPGEDALIGDARAGLLALPGALQAVDDCIAKGVKAVVMFSSGFAETGADGRVLQEQLTRRCAEGGLKLLAGNCGRAGCSYPTPRPISC